MDQALAIAKVISKEATGEDMGIQSHMCKP